MAMKQELSGTLGSLGRSLPSAWPGECSEEGASAAGEPEGGKRQSKEESLAQMRV